jgi:predicted nuclease of predicted toxin-antitoxin system
MKFLGDMGISPRTIALLREQGYDAIHLIEEKIVYSRLNVVVQDLHDQC